MAGAQAANINNFVVAHNAILTAGKNGAINITTPHNRGHFNCDLDPTKSGVTTQVCPQKLISEVTTNFRSGRYFVDSDSRLASEYEAEFTDAIGRLRNSTQTGRFVYIKLKKELHPEYKLNYQFYLETLTVTATPRLNVGNGPNSQTSTNTIPNAAVARDW